MHKHTKYEQTVRGRLRRKHSGRCHTTLLPLFLWKLTGISYLGHRGGEWESRTDNAAGGSGAGGWFSPRNAVQTLPSSSLPPHLVYYTALALKSLRTSAMGLLARSSAPHPSLKCIIRLSAPKTRIACHRESEKKKTQQAAIVLSGT